MSSLRFLRPDDAHLLVTALNVLAPPGSPMADMDRETLRQWMTTYGTRPGNCMVLSEREDLHGVLLSARREREEGLIQELFIHPTRRRKGQATEMVRDLLKKVHIQGMRVMNLEVPHDGAARAFAASLGFVPHCEGVDLVFSLPVDEAEAMAPGYALQPLDPAAVAGLDHWYQGTAAFAPPEEGMEGETFLFTTPTGSHALAGHDDLLLAWVVLEGRGPVAEDLAAVSHRFLWGQCKGLPVGHPLLTVFPGDVAFQERRWLYRRDVHVEE